MRPAVGSGSAPSFSLPLLLGFRVAVVALAG